MENQEKQHKRRVRYKGTHPRSYKEKYKELNPEKYPETVEKSNRKGRDSRWDAYFYLCKRNFGFFPDRTGTERVGCNPWIWRSHIGNVKMSQR